MRLFRIGSAHHPIWDGSGAALHGGRWNPAGAAVIYAAGSRSLAMLERLVQRSSLSRSLLIEAEVPEDVAVDDLMAAPPEGWREIGSPAAVAAGGAWLAARRGALLRVPSALVPEEANYLVNPAHPEAARIRLGTPGPLEWDARLFGIPPPR